MTYSKFRSKGAGVGEVL